MESTSEALQPEAFVITDYRSECSHCAFLQFFIMRIVDSYQDLAKNCHFIMKHLNIRIFEPIFSYFQNFVFVCGVFQRASLYYGIIEPSESIITIIG